MRGIGTSGVRARNVLVTLFMLGCVAFFAWWNATKPRILVLQSYDPDYAWSREIATGIQRVLGGKPGYSIRQHYMDTKRHPWPDFMVRAGVHARRIIDEWHPDVVIAVDDDAQEHVMKHYANHPRIRIVFAGLNGDIDDYGYRRASNVTGILERIPWYAIRDALLASDLRLAKRELRLLHLGDGSRSSLEDVADLKRFNWAPLELVTVRHASSFAEWKSAVELAPAEADVILIGNYRQLAAAPGSKDFADPRQLVKWTEANAMLPLIGFKVAYGEEGGAIAISSSPYEQGEVAARMALQILEKNVAPREIPVQHGRQFVVSVDDAGLKSQGLRLPPLYEAFARANNTFR